MLSIAGYRFDARLVIFDKDGTLIAFDAMWHTWFSCLMNEIAAKVSFSTELKHSFGQILGYDPDLDRWDPLGPLTLASTAEVGLLLAGQIYGFCGLTWNEALAVVEGAEEKARALLGTADLVQPVGPVQALMRKLTERDVKIAVATTDTRASTEAHLTGLGLDGFVSMTVCGDDGLRLKPAPDMALEVCRRLGVAPREALMVGDTISDLQMARAAGLLGAIGVCTGAVPGEMLRPYADLVVSDIHAIEVVADDR